MGDVNWNSFYGINKGNATVIQGNPALDDLKQTIATNLAQKQQQIAQLNSSLAKINFNGANNHDIPILQKGYNDVLNKFAQLQSTNNPIQRAVLKNQIQQGQQALLYQAAQSKANNDELVKKADIQNNPTAVLSDDFHAGMTNLMSKPTLRDDFHNDLNTFGQTMFAPKVDILATNKKIADASADDVPNKLSNGMVGNVNVLMQTGGKQLNQNKVLQNVTDALKGDKNLRTNVIAQYGTPEAYAKAIYDQHKDDYKVETKQVGHEFPQRAERYTMAQLWNLSHYGTPNAPTASNTPTYIQDLSQRLRTPTTSEAASSELNSIISSNPAYNKAIAFKYNGDGTFNLTVPAKYNYDAKKVALDDNNKPIPNTGRAVIKPSYTIKVDPRNQQEFDTQIGTVYKDVTGDATGTPSKVLTTGGKGHVLPNQATTQPAYQHIQSAKDSKGNVISLGYKNGKWYNTKTNQTVQ